MCRPVSDFSYQAIDSLNGVPAHRADLQLRGATVTETPRNKYISIGENSLWFYVLVFAGH